MLYLEINTNNNQSIEIMELVDRLIELKKSHANYFQKYLPHERLRYSTQIISLKKDIDKLEGSLISGILSFQYDYTVVYPELKKHNFESFIDESEAIQNYLVNSSISNSVGHNRLTRLDAVAEFKEMCLRFWDDYIITTEERRELNSFCNENSIDIITQQLIESEIISIINKDYFDTKKIINYYLAEEGLEAKSIHKILKKEYKLRVPVEKIEGIISDLSADKNLKGMLGSQPNIIYKLNFGKATVIIDLIDDENLSKEFKISYVTGTSGNYKISIPKPVYEISSSSELIDIISDAICFKNSYQNVNEFLELKPKIKRALREMISN